MGLKEFMIFEKSLNNFIYIGKMAAFYVPSNKLSKKEFGENGETPKDMFHNFFMKNFNAYTHEKSGIEGFWREKKGAIVIDENERYEVSFLDDNEQLEKFIKFLSKMCNLLNENSIYVTIGDSSWLVKKEES
jgi:hypothetical protein